MVPIDTALKQGTWPHSAFMGRELSGSKLGIVGCGAVGSSLVALCRPFDLEIRIYDPYIAPDTIPAGVGRVRDLGDPERPARDLVEAHRGHEVAGPQQREQLPGVQLRHEEAREPRQHQAEIAREGMEIAHVHVRHAVALGAQRPHRLLDRAVGASPPHDRQVPGLLALRHILRHTLRHTLPQMLLHT